MNTEERVMLREGIVRLLAETDSANVASALAEFGWFELLDDEPHEAIPVLFETQGEGLHVSAVLSMLMAGPLAAQTVVLPGPGSGAEPGSVLDHDAVHVRGFGPSGIVTTGPVAVPARRDGELVIVTVDAGKLDGQAVEGIDPAFDLCRFNRRVPITAISAQASDADAAWTAAVTIGRKALAHELLGTSRRMLALAVEHAGQRHQFGGPIGRFQAVKHRLAEAYVALAAAEAAAAEAWVDEDPFCATLAKLWAGRAGRMVAKHTQQTLGGMGFTWEHAFHRYFRRTILLDSLLGSAPELTAEVGRTLTTSGGIPQLAAL